MVSPSLHTGGSLSHGCRGPLQALVCLITFFATFATASPQEFTVGASRELLATRAVELESCLTAAKINATMPGDTAKFTENTAAWNLRISPKPATVVFPKTEADVTAALNCAAKSKTKVTTLGGNRSFSSLGFGRNNGAMVINLSNMKSVEIDNKTNLMTFAGPVDIAEAAFMAHKHNMSVPHGRCPDVGMSGVAASGFGTLSRKTGTVLDNIMGDLYWGIRGAASSLGVVLKWKIKTYPIVSNTVTNYTISFPDKYKPSQQDNVNMLLALQNWGLSKDNTDYMSARLGIRTSSEIVGFHYGTTDEFEKASAALMKLMPSAARLESNVSDFWESENRNTPGLHDNTPGPRRFFYITSATIPVAKPLTNETAWSLFNNTLYYKDKPFSDKADSKKGSASGFVDLWGGEFTKSLKENTTAWKHNANLLLVRWDLRTATANITFPEEYITNLRTGFYKFVDDYKSAGGTVGGFTTYRDDKLPIAQLGDLLYGKNYEKLRELKTTYDPDELFNTDPQSIPAGKKKHHR